MAGADFFEKRRDLAVETLEKCVPVCRKDSDLRRLVCEVSSEQL